MLGYLKKFKIEIILLAIGLISRSLFLSRELFNWDAAQFALALHHYNVTFHQPHPPGYPLFVGFGKILFYLGGNENFSLTLAAVFLSLGAILFFYKLARLIFNQNRALLTGLLFIFNPFFWFHGEIALSYAADAFFSVLIAYLVFKGYRTKKVAFFYWSSLALGFAGGFRPSLTFFLFFVWLLNFRTFRKIKTLFQSGLILFGAVGVWFLPLIFISGGKSFASALRNLFFSAADESSIFLGAPLAKWVEQLKNVYQVTFVSLNVLLIFVLINLYAFCKKRGGLFKRHKFILTLFLVWFLPSAFFYLFIHFGQAGYLLTIFPLLILLASPKIEFLEKKFYFAIASFLILFQILFFFQTGPVALGVPPKTKLAYLNKRLYYFNPWISKFNLKSIRAEDRKLKNYREALQKIIKIEKDPVFILKKGGKPDIFRHLMIYFPGTKIYEFIPGKIIFEGFNFKTGYVKNNSTGKNYPLTLSSKQTLIFVNFKPVTGAPTPPGEIMVPQESKMYFIKNPLSGTVFKSTDQTVETKVE